MIANVAFRNFKALRNARVDLGAFNLVLGPNGSGKTSLIDALLHLRGLSQLSPVDEFVGLECDAPTLTFHFSAPHESTEVRLGCVGDVACNALQVVSSGAASWSELRPLVSRIRSYTFDHNAMARPAKHRAGISEDLAPDGGNLAAVVGALQDASPIKFSGLAAELLRLFPEFTAFNVRSGANQMMTLSFTLAGGAGLVEGDSVSQGMLYTLAVLTLSLLPSPPTVVCIEEVDRGVHPRMLREIRDALYRLSYPASFGLARPPVQVIATTHSPYLLDLFRDHPEEVIISQKHGTSAQFQRLSERADLAEILQEGSLGDLWYSGILGGVPEP